MRNIFEIFREGHHHSIQNCNIYTTAPMKRLFALVIRTLILVCMF